MDEPPVENDVDLTKRLEQLEREARDNEARLSRLFEREVALSR